MPLLKGQIVLETTYTYEGLLDLLAEAPENILSEEITEEEVEKISSYGNKLWKLWGKQSDMDYWDKQGLTLARVKQLYVEHGKSIPELARYLAVSVKDLRKWLRQFPDDPFAKKECSRNANLPKELLVKMLAEGLSYTEIAIELGYPHTTIIQAAYRHGLAKRRKLLTPQSFLELLATCGTREEVVAKSGYGLAGLQGFARHKGLTKEAAMLWPEGWKPRAVRA